MKPGPTVVACCLVGGLAAGVVKEQSDMPPHVHEESQSPLGPNVSTLAFAESGSTVVVVIQRVPPSK
jgi:hypothetical protein